MSNGASWWDKAVKALACACGAVAGALGGLDTVLIVLVACMTVDYLCGLAVGWMGCSPKTENGRLDSKTGARGIAKKGLMLAVVLVAALLDRAMGAQNAMFRDAVIWYYVANEALSILENLALAGVPFPARLRAALEQLRQKQDKEE